MKKILRFCDEYVSRQDRYSIGQDCVENQYFLSIPVTNQQADYEEYYKITKLEYNIFIQDGERAKAFADECRLRTNDARLILCAGSDRGVAI